MQVAVAKADAYGGNPRGAGGDVGVVVGDAVVVRQGAYEGDAAVKCQGVAQFFVVGRGHGRVAVEDAPKPYHVGAGGAVVEDGRAAAEVAVGEGQAGLQFLDGAFKAADLPVGEGDVVRGGGEV